METTPSPWIQHHRHWYNTIAMGTPPSPWVHRHRHGYTAIADIGLQHETYAWDAWPLSCKVLLRATPSYCVAEHLYGHRREPVKSTSVAKLVWQEILTTFVVASIRTPVADLFIMRGRRFTNCTSAVIWLISTLQTPWPSRRTRGTYTCCRALSSEAVTTCSVAAAIRTPNFLRGEAAREVANGIHI